MEGTKPAPKRGKEGGRRRSVVSISMAADTLYTLDRLAATFTNWQGKPISRSAMIRKLVNMGAAVVAGRDVRDLRQF